MALTANSAAPSITTPGPPRQALPSQPFGVGSLAPFPLAMLRTGGAGAVETEVVAAPDAASTAASVGPGRPVQPRATATYSRGRAGPRPQINPQPQPYAQPGQQLYLRPGLRPDAQPYPQPYIQPGPQPYSRPGPAPYSQPSPQQYPGHPYSQARPQAYLQPYMQPGSRPGPGLNRPQSASRRISQVIQPTAAQRWAQQARAAAQAGRPIPPPPSTTASAFGGAVPVDPRKRANAAQSAQSRNAKGLAVSVFIVVLLAVAFGVISALLGAGG